MNDVKDKTAEDLFESIDELEQLVKIRLGIPAGAHPELEKKLAELEKKFDLIRERNQRVDCELDQVIAELEKLLKDEKNKCPQ